MSENVLPKGFFNKHPLQKVSSAIFADFKASADKNSEIGNMVEDTVYAAVTDERRARIEQEKQVIGQLSSGEDIERFMRKKHDSMSDTYLLKKALSIEDDAASHIIGRYKTTIQDAFTELAFRFFVLADKRYTEELYTVYHEIRSPYAQAVACLLFGEQDRMHSIPLLLKEYERFRVEYPNEGFEQYPLLALYILFGKA